MSIVSNNIKYLRRLNGLTQEQFARKIAIKRSLLGAYEEARANPNLTNLKNMAAAFGITVDNLLKNDLRKLRETPDMSLPLNGSRPMTVSHSGAMPAAGNSRLQVFSEPQPLSKIIEQYPAPDPEIRTVSRQVNLKPVSGETVPAKAPARIAEPQPQPVHTVPQAPASPAEFPVFNNQYAGTETSVQPAAVTFPTIQWVSKSQENDYLTNFQNPGYLTRLPVFQLPNLPAGYYRAFEGGLDFATPGTLLVGSFVRNWYEIQDGAQYIFVLRHEGIVCRKVYNQVKISGSLLLRSDVPGIADMQMPLQDVFEVWEIKAFVGTQAPAPQPSIEKLEMLVDALQKEIDVLKKG